jgi:uncharacterized protein YkwD
MAPRARGLACVCALLALLLSSPALAARSSYSTSLESSVLQQLNQIRVAHGLNPLELSSQLSAAATAHSLDMLANGFFAHASSDGLSFAQRIAEYYPPAAASFWSVGENLLWSAGHIDAATSLAAWMADPGHRANILSPTWRQIGISAESSSDAPGVFGGEAVTVITTDFGARTDPGDESGAGDPTPPQSPPLTPPGTAILLSQ